MSFVEPLPAMPASLIFSLVPALHIVSSHSPPKKPLRALHFKNLLVSSFLSEGEVGELSGRIRSNLGTPALKTENFSKKIGRFSKTQKRIY